MNLKLCEKRFLVINSPFFLHVPAFVLDCVHAVQWVGGGGGGGGDPPFCSGVGGVIGIPHSDLEVVLRDKE